MSFYKIKLLNDNFESILYLNVFHKTKKKKNNLTLIGFKINFPRDFCQNYEFCLKKIYNKYIRTSLSEAHEDMSELKRNL